MTTTFEISNGDVVIDRNNGQPALIADGLKLKQDLRIALGTEARAENVGAGLEDTIKGRATTPSLMENAIERNLEQSATMMETLQTQFQRTERPAEEQLVRLAAVQVTTNVEDPTAYYFKAEYITARGRVQLAGRIA